MLRRNSVQTMTSAPVGADLLSQLHALTTIMVTSLGGGLHVLSGAGGNIAILEGEDGLLLVDSGLPATVEAVLAEMGKIGKGHITHLINTHYHFDHTGGNVRMGTDGAMILAHVNVRARLTTKQTNPFLNRTFEPLAAVGLPSATFTGPGRLTHGGERVEYRCLPPAHTDSDTVVVFANANVHHASDLYFHGTYPLIDYSVGGSLAGMAADAETLWKSVDGSSRIIPGHGPMSDKDEFKSYADMLAASLEIMNKQLQAGKTLEQMLAARPFQAYDEKWGQGFMNAEQWIRMNYAGMTTRTQHATA